MDSVGVYEGQCVQEWSVLSLRVEKVLPDLKCKGSACLHIFVDP